MVDISVKSGAAWTCDAERGRHLSDVLLPVHITDHHEEDLLSEDDDKHCGVPVLLEQTEEGSPCVLALRCRPDPPAAIRRLLLISEARTMEVYSQTGEYCGTTRGQRDAGVHTDGSDRGPFYKKQLILDHPSTACDVKLLSLGGRVSVLVCRVMVGVEALQPCAAAAAFRGPNIDMQQVQSLVEEMGASLSPGAQNLMDMVHFQQKNQSSSLGGFLPLLMGGAAGGGVFSALTHGTDSMVSPADEAPPPPVSGSSSPRRMLSAVDTENRPSSESHTHLAEMMMSHLLKGAGHGGPELLPVLHNLCSQVTKLRLDDAAALTETEKRNGSWELDAAMERRLDEMERRLKEHVDRRLDALEQKLEKVLLNAVNRVHGTAGAHRPDAGHAPTAEPLKDEP